MGVIVIRDPIQHAHSLMCRAHSHQEFTTEKQLFATSYEKCLQSNEIGFQRNKASNFACNFLN